VSKVDPTTGREVGRASTGGPHGADVRFAIATGAGRVWVTRSIGGAIYAIEPTTNAVTKRIIDPPRGPGGNASPQSADLSQLAVSGTDVWVCCGFDLQLQKIDTRTLSVIAEIRADFSCASAPVGMATGPRGTWVLTSCLAVRPRSEGEVMLIPPGRPDPGGFLPVGYRALPAGIGVGFGHMWIGTSDGGTSPGYLERVVLNAQLQPTQLVPAPGGSDNALRIASWAALLVSVFALAVVVVRRRRSRERFAR
jgi:DNA-binding beta-propeller fold protein YncE